MSRFDPPHILDPDHDDTDRESLDTALSEADERFITTLRENLHLLPVEHPASGFDDSGLEAWKEVDRMFERHSVTAPLRLRDHFAMVLVWARYGRKEAARDERDRETLLHAISGTHYET